MEELVAIYLLVGAYFAILWDFVPFEEYNKWNFNSWVLFYFGIIFWLPVLIYILINIIIDEFKT